MQGSEGRGSAGQAGGTECSQECQERDGGSGARETTPLTLPPFLWFQHLSLSLSISWQNVALLERKLSSVEEELGETRGAVEEERGRESEWREGRDHLQTDLKVTEKKLEDTYAKLEKEKAQRCIYTNSYSHSNGLDH